MQLPLFPVEIPDPPDNTPNPLTLLRTVAALVLSVSGGKDSDVMCHHLIERRQTEGWSGDVVMIHADLGTRVEWVQAISTIIAIYPRGKALHPLCTSDHSRIATSALLHC